MCVQGPLVIPTEEQKGQSALHTGKRKSIYDTITDTEMVEQVFGFLPSIIGGQEGQAPPRFEVRWALSFKGLAQVGRGVGKERPQARPHSTSRLIEKPRLSGERCGRGLQGQW